ncbi:Fic family protein [Microgenomates group bacterium]|nr:Fic family protein [Microgenomates group bacterium]
MDDTQINLRQEAILNLLSQIPVSRSKLGAELKNQYPVSKLTLIRDLKSLVDSGLVKTQGIGKSTVYISLQNPLLKFIDLRRYFSQDSKLRVNVKTGFDFSVFNYLRTALMEKELKKKLLRLSRQEKKLDPTIFKREIERFTVEFSWKSSRIEGNTYSLLETDILIRQMKEAEGHPREEAIMILNHKAAIDYILKNREEFRRLTLEKVLKIHALLTGGLGISAAIRSNPVAITGTHYLPLTERDALIKALKQTIEVINAVKNPLSKAFMASFMIAYIQPFTDGNKRTSRTLTNAILIAYDLYPLSYRDVKEIDYLESMLLFYEQNNLYHLKQMFVDQLDFSQNNYFRT